MKTFIGVKLIKAEEMKAEPYPYSSGPESEGYRVVYADGYVSWSPKKAFDDAYRPIDEMTFGLAIEAMKKGRRVARKGWNGRGIFIELQIPDTHSKMTHPYIFIDTTGLQTENPDAPKNRVPWLASQTDMLSEDWIILGGIE